jgi:hypothetical protein
MGLTKRSLNQLLEMPAWEEILTIKTNSLRNAQIVDLTSVNTEKLCLPERTTTLSNPRIISTSIHQSK